MSEREPVSGRPLVAALALYVLLGGIVSFLGWPLDAPRLTDWVGNGISIQPNTTVAVTCAGSALLLLSLGFRRSAVAFSIVVAAIGASALFQYVAGVNFGSLNTWLMFGREWGRVGVLYPGRMGPPGAVGWTLIGVTLALAAAPHGSWRRRAVPKLALLTLGLATLSIAGYIYRADPLYTMPYLTVIAAQTATFVAAASAAAIASVPELPPMRWLVDRGATGAVARRAVPLVILVPFVVGWLRLSGELRGLYDARFGVAVFVLALNALLLAVLWWSLTTIARHEAALRASERRVKDTLESITDGFVTFDAQWRFVFVNDEGARLLQRSRFALLGRTIWEMFPEMVGSPAYIELNRAAATRISVEYEDFDPVLARWFANKAYPTHDGGMALYFQDVTERKLFKQQMDADIAAIRRLQALSTQLVRSGELKPLLQEILATAADLTGTEMGNIQFCDPETERLRIVVHQGLGRRFLEHFADDGWEKGCGAAAVTKYRHIVEDLTLLGEAKDSPELEILLEAGIRAFQSTPLVSRDGRLLGMLNNHFRTPGRPHERALRFLDVLARQAADLIERKQAEDALSDADRRKDEFLATLAHELRNPLAPVRNSLELLKRGVDDPEITSRARATMERQIAHMVRLIDDLLDVSRISRNKLELSRERVELAAVVHHAVEVCRPACEAACHDLSVVLPPEPVWLNADPLRLAQVFGNLLTNACKYTEPGGRISIAAELQGDEVVVRVSDNGLGIPPEMIPKVFDMFTQVDRSLERSAGGLGIGLALVKRLVELHEGSVAGESDGLGRGSAFVVRLPVLATGGRPESAPSPLPDAVATIPRRILVVDDNIDSAVSLGTLLKMTGHDAILAHDGITAAEKAGAYRPDLILLDIGLPRRNGYDTCRAIRGEPWGAEVVMIALTGWGQLEDRRKSSEAGFDGHLVKPVDHDALMRLLASLPASA